MDLLARGRFMISARGKVCRHGRLAQRRRLLVFATSTIRPWPIPELRSGTPQPQWAPALASEPIAFGLAWIALARATRSKVLTAAPPTRDQ